MARIIDDGTGPIVHIQIKRGGVGLGPTWHDVYHVAIAGDGKSGRCLESDIVIPGSNRAEIAGGFARALEGNHGTA